MTFAINNKNSEFVELFNNLVQIDYSNLAYGIVVPANFHFTEGSTYESLINDCISSNVTIDILRPYFDKCVTMTLSTALSLIRNLISVDDPSVNDADNMTREYKIYTFDEVSRMKEIGLNSYTIKSAEEFEISFDTMISLRSDILNDRWKGIGFDKYDGNVTMFIL
jgi:hypothetical protein